MTHSPSDRSEDTADYQVPGEHRQRHERRRHNDRVTHTLKLLSVWCAAIIGVGIVLKSSWVTIDTVITAQHSFAAMGASMTQLSNNLSTQTDQLRQMQLQLSALVRHDSLQDEQLGEDHKQIVGLNRRKADK